MVVVVFGNVVQLDVQGRRSKRSLGGSNSGQWVVHAASCSIFKVRLSVSFDVDKATGPTAVYKQDEKENSMRISVSEWVWKILDDRESCLVYIDVR